MADAKQALEDLALLVRLSDRMADDGGGSMYHADTLAQRNAVVRRLREFIESADGVGACLSRDGEPSHCVLWKCHEAKTCARGVTVAPASMPKDLADRIAIALECGILWCHGSEAHERMVSTFAAFNVWRTAGVQEVGRG
jgi:hypothetical protein